MRDLGRRLQHLEERADRLVQDTPSAHFPHVVRAILQDAQAGKLACAATEAQARGDTEGVNRLMQELLARLYALPEESWRDLAGAAVPGLTPEAVALMIQRESDSFRTH